MELLTIFLRTVFVYFFILFILRLMGKREIGKLSIFDLVVSIMIAEAAVILIEDHKKPLVHGVVPIVLLGGIQIIMAYISLKNEKIRSIVDGKPAVLIEKGKINDSEMKKLRYNMDDLMAQLREKDVANVADVEFAILETSGKLSVFTKNDFKGTPIPKRPRSPGLPMPIIMDGKVNDQNLEKLGVTRFWLKNQLEIFGIRDFKEVAFATIDHRGEIYLDKKDKKDKN
ncbi:DUF421 domain-containing protein [Microaerobacter geothermalis]|uniref:DUF421 domain-containing protein n=1 Tax=Microaerobacter geothermalis TaxID=674972 RepID=UPI0038B331E5